ncbi:MAG TPA: class I SAM-dependent methyltransferase [Caulobacteraceae bacterium]|nr:class I SAM-dependent methyltransferase [Caulobacteraceae bacterium]
MPDYFALNRAHWDEVTGIHVASPFYRTEAFRRGAMVLDPIAVEGVGEVEGKRLLHLQCHFGLDTLSLARLGAQVTGLDFSAPALKEARALSAETGVRARFIEANVLAPPADLVGFDVVFASWGAICWIPDMPAWMRTAANALRPGGRLVLIDGHPAMLMMAGEGRAPFSVRYPYQTDEPIMMEEAGDYADATAKVAANRTAEWMHGIGRILNAAVDAGLVIRRFDELDRVPWHALAQLEEAGDGYWRLPTSAPAFPLAFRLLAERA